VPHWRNLTCSLVSCQPDEKGCRLSALLSARDNLGDTVAQALPATYAVEAGRKVMDGLLCADVAGLLGTHVASGAA